MSHSIAPQLPAIHPATRIFDRLMRDYTGSAALRLWNNTLHPRGNAPSSPWSCATPPCCVSWCLTETPFALRTPIFRGS